MTNIKQFTSENWQLVHFPKTPPETSFASSAVDLIEAQTALWLLIQMLSHVLGHHCPLDTLASSLFTFKQRQEDSTTSYQGALSISSHLEKSKTTHLYIQLLVCFAIKLCKTYGENNIFLFIKDHTAICRDYLLCLVFILTLSELKGYCSIHLFLTILEYL